MLTFDEILSQVVELLRREGRVAYRVLKRRFALDDEYIEDLKADLIDAKGVAVDEDGKVLVWTGAAPVSSATFQVPGSQPLAPSTQHRDSSLTDGERRQLTVLFCDLVDSTALSTRLDPEELRDVVRAYQQTSAAVIDHYTGHIAQHLGDGLLVYFGYPVAHEDDAQRAVRAALGIVEAIRQAPLCQQHDIQLRIGIHTGLVVVGEIGSSTKREVLALGETPNLAARVQGIAEPDTVVVSAATYRLIQGLFECQARGPQELKGIATLVSVYRVLRESEAQSRFEAALSAGLTPLVGREHEVGLLAERWALAEQGQREEGIAQMHRGLAALGATGAKLGQSTDLATLAEAYGKEGQAEEGLTLLAEALAVVQETDERYRQAELYRVKGTLTLQSQTSLGQVSGKSEASQNTSEDTSPQHTTPSTQAEAEECFLKAIEIAQRQQAKSLELRATVSLARLWRQQGKTAEARELLAPVYNWFTEGFDTVDLKEAKELLAKLETT